MKSEVWIKAIKKSNEFYASNKAFYFFISITTIFSLIQIIVFSTGLMKVNGSTIDEAILNGKLISTWILLFVSIFGTYCGFIGGIMLFRNNLSFVYWQTTSTMLSFITQSLANMWFGAFVSIYFAFMNITRYFIWKNNLIEKWNFSSQKIMTISFIMFVITLFLMNFIATFWSEEIYYISDPNGWMLQWNANFDATGASLNMTASFIMLFKVRWAFVFYALAKVFTIVNYACAGLIVPIVQMSLFWIMDFTGFIGWSINGLKEKETYIE